MSNVPENDIKSAVAHLESLSDNELKKLIDDEETLDRFIAGLPLVC